ncbi:MAG: hypothetical protein M1816_006605 [Peltula sp. TS41687]|nr:MAG: hypothetical protein M1816_006605 [Peltula sp. TS41687]
MSYHANGQDSNRRYDHAYSASPSLPPSSTSYGIQPPYPTENDSPVRRIPSFDYGDDAQSGDVHNAGRSPSQPPSNPASSYIPALAGYRHQYQPQASPSVTAPYNPQLFAHVQSSHTSQPQSNAQVGGHSGGYQPYNPALYGNQSMQSPLMSSRQSPRLDQHGFPATTAHGSQRSLLSESQIAQQMGRLPSQYRNWIQPVQSSPPLPSTTYVMNNSHRPLQYSPQIPPPPSRSSGMATPGSTSENGFSPTLQSVREQSWPTSYPSQITRSDSTRLNPHELPPPPHYEDDDVMDDHDESAISFPTPPPHERTHPLPPPPGPSPPRQRQMPTRHPQSRPLPGPPVEYDTNDDLTLYPSTESEQTDEELTQESIWREVEAAVMNPGASTSADLLSPRSGGYIQEGSSSEFFVRAHDDRLDAQAGLRINGHSTSTSSDKYAEYDSDSDDSDPEAAAGLAAMRLADEEEAANEARRESGRAPIIGTYASQQHPHHDDVAENGSESDYGNIDMDLYGGGYEGHVSYANGHFNESDDLVQGTRLVGRQLANHYEQRQHMPPNSTMRDQSTVNEYPPIRPVARVDTSGTGGLADPSAHKRKMSFEDGDEPSWEGHSVRTSGSQSPSKSEYSEMYRQTGMHPSSADRPLPQVPPPWGNGVPQLKTTAAYEGGVRYQLYNERGTRIPGPDLLNTSQLNSPTSLAVPRSSSLSSHSNTPQTIPPVRSKTDAEERKAKLAKFQQLGIYSPTLGSELSLDSAVPQSAVALDLPEIPAGKRKRFHPAKLSTAEFKKCNEPWALSAIAAWVKDLSEDETDLKETTVINGVVALFTHKVPTMNIADAEMLSSRVVQEMFAAGALVRDEEWVKFGSETVTGVIWQLTCSGCYAPKLHSQDMAGRCYSHHCSRTLKKINLQAQVLESQRKTEDWTTFYKVKKEDLENVPRKEIERQNILHEIVQGEDQYMDQLNVLLVLYRDQLLSCQPPIIQPSRVDKFAKDVFGKVDAVKKVNEDFLLAQIKYRQQEQGPWIIGFSDIFREWIRKARNAYIEYAANFPHASLMVRKEAERNILFRQFLDEVRDNERSKRLGWDTFLKAPITRLQHYGLLLSTVLKNTLQETEEKTNLQAAIEEIKAVTHECDARVAEMSKKVELTELGSKLLIRKGLHCDELNLDHWGRELIFEGDLQRTGANRFTWLETHAILFDHYLVLAKTVHQKASGSIVKQDIYDVSKRPISMDLLVLESCHDDPVVKSSVKGIGAVTTVTTKAPSSSDLRHNRAISNQGPGPGTLTQTNTNSSIASVATTASGKSIVTTTVLETSKDEKTMYPFRIQHLGREVYTLYAPSAQNRQDWCDKILEAKTKHAASLFAQNAEPFRLRVMADTAFAYDALAGGPKGTVIKGTPLDRAIREVEGVFATAGPGPRPGPICRAAVHCATAFIQPYGKQMVAIGTDYGVYISEAENPRGWIRAITIGRVTQIAVLEEFSLFLLIADKSLIAYHLDIVCPVNGMPPRNDSLTKAPQKLSGNREVGFFATGRMKDRTLVFYKKREGLSSTFKVLEPIFHKATEKKSRFSRKGTTEFFREFDEFYIPTECFGINVFRSYLANATARGFEVLNLDKKQGYGVPDLKAPHVSSIAARLTNQKPLGMFRLNDTEFLLSYEECAVYANKHGDVSRSVVMEYIDRARSAAIYGPYVLLFGNDYVEIRNAENGRLRQVIAGRDVRCLDDAQTGGSAGRRTIKITMQHPELERMQLVLELVLNEGQRD